MTGAIRELRITSQTDGLTALKTKVGTETTVAALKDDAKKMIVDYRVFILTGPKMRLTAAIDTELAAVTKLHDNKNIDDAKLDAVAAGLNGKVDTLLGFTPGPDGDAIRAEVKTVRDAAKDAHTQLKALRRQPSNGCRYRSSGCGGRSSRTPHWLPGSR
ncbi:hypothetical protein [Actinoplanes italicus]|uniref:hypothetical protein n=1 Tax=Actinoplanes italicus TaxID=113567 RepID=UPI0011B1FDFE|nr:hypothetical protein [Actinoplanes italicus]